MDCRAPSRILCPRFPGASRREGALDDLELDLRQQMWVWGRWAKGSWVARTRTPKGRERWEGMWIGSLPGAGVDEVRVATVEGGQGAISGSFPSSSL